LGPNFRVRLYGPPLYTNYEKMQAEPFVNSAYSRFEYAIKSPETHEKISELNLKE